MSYKHLIVWVLFAIFSTSTTFSFAQKTEKGEFKDVIVLDFQVPFKKIVVDYDSDEFDLALAENCEFLGKKKKDVDPAKIVPSSMVNLEFELINGERIVTKVLSALNENGIIELSGLLEGVEKDIAFIDGYKVKLAPNTHLVGDSKDKCECKKLLAPSFTDKLIKPGFLFMEVEGKMNEQGIVEATKIEFCKNTVSEADYKLRTSVEQGYNTQKLTEVAKPANLPFEVGLPLHGGNINIGEYSYKLHNNILLQGYVNSVGEKLIPQHQKNLSPDDVSKINYRFYVIEDPIPNAFAFPNGMIFIHTGILDLMDNEAELAIVLGHEIAHVTHEHGRERYEGVIDASALINPFTQLLSRYTKGLNIPTALSSSIRKTYTALRPDGIANIFNPQPARESQADRVGLQYAYLAGYDVRESVNFWNKMKRLTNEGSFKAKVNSNFKTMLGSANFSYGNPITTLGDIGFNVLAKMFLETVYTSHPKSKVRAQALNQLIISGYPGEDFNGFTKGEAEFKKYVRGGK